jgi:uncharacterized protein
MRVIIIKRAVASRHAVAGILALTLTGIAGNAAAQWQDEPTQKVPITSFPFPLSAKAYFDTYYNVCRGPNPACYNPWVPDAGRADRVLIYSRTAGPRHAHLGSALGPGLNPTLGANNVSQAALVKWMAEVGVKADWTEDVSVLGSTNLNVYKAIIFDSTSRDTFWKHGSAVLPANAVDTSTNAHLDAAKTALRQYMRSGGGFVGVHNAVGGTEYNWVYYEGLSGGTQYYDHGPQQSGTVRVNNTDTSNDGLPPTWSISDEWYNFVPFPARVKFLLTVDETSLASPPGGNVTAHPGHGAFHPMAWCQYYDGGRAFITGLGHDTKAYQDGSGFTGQAYFKSHLVNGILGAMGNIRFCEVPPLVQ